MSEEIGVSLPPEKYTPLPTWDEWRQEAEKREEQRLGLIMAQRLRCSTEGCDEIATTWVYKLDTDGEPLPSGEAEYVACWEHARSSGPCSINRIGFMPDGATWTEGFIKWGGPE